jgi:hypothetical protein
MFADGTRPALGSGGRVDLLGELAPRVTSLGDEYQNRSNWLTEISQPFSPRTRATSNRRRFFKSCRSVERRSKCASMKSTRLPTGTTRNVTVSGLDGSFHPCCAWPDKVCTARGHDNVVWQPGL